MNDLNLRQEEPETEPDRLPELDAKILALKESESALSLQQIAERLQTNKMKVHRVLNRSRNSRNTVAECYDPDANAQTPTLGERIKELEQEAATVEYAIQNAGFNTSVDEVERLFTRQKAVSHLIGVVRSEIAEAERQEAARIAEEQRQKRGVRKRMDKLFDYIEIDERQLKMIGGRLTARWFDPGQSAEALQAEYNRIKNEAIPQMRTELAQLIRDNPYIVAEREKELAGVKTDEQLEQEKLHVQQCAELQKHWSARGLVSPHLDQLQNNVHPVVDFWTIEAFGSELFDRLCPQETMGRTVGSPLTGILDFGDLQVAMQLKAVIQPGFQLPVGILFLHHQRFRRADDGYRFSEDGAFFCHCGQVANALYLKKRDLLQTHNPYFACARCTAATTTPNAVHHPGKFISNEKLDQIQAAAKSEESNAEVVIQ